MSIAALTQREFLTNLAEFVVIAWSVCGIVLCMVGWIAPLFLLMFVFSRIRQLRDRDWDARPLSTTGNGYHFLFACVFGLTLPAFYFLSVRTRHAIGIWYLGPDTNSPLTIALGVICMAWLLTRIIQAGVRFDRPRFDAWPFDAIMAAIATGLCLWFHVKTLMANIPAPAEHLATLSTSDLRFMTHWYPRIVYPQTCFGTATAVYGFALAEAILAHRRGESSRRPMLALLASALLLLLLFAPLWLSIPRTTHAQAMDLLQTNRDAIATAAAEADLDPNLLAGIIYVAHTRDRPRLSGDAIEIFALRIWGQDIQSGISGELGTVMLNPSVGLSQMRPSTAAQTLSLIESIPALHRMPASSTEFKKANSPLPPMTYTWSPVRNIAGPFQSNHARRFSACTHFSPTMRPIVDRLISQLQGYTIEADMITVRGSLDLAAAMLAILRAQWETAGQSIADRPEILATLYNIGYERSVPHADPRANDFGRRVAAFMQTDDCRALFAQSTAEAASDER